MGSSSSSEEDTEIKTVDSTGPVNNNIILQREARDTHSQMILNQKILFVGCIMVLFEIIKLAIYLVNSYKKRVKKAYVGNNA